MNILMITHHRRNRTGGRSQVMAYYLAKRGHQVSLMVTADQFKFGWHETEQDGVHIIEMPDLLWGRMRSGWDIWSLLNRLIYVGRDQQPYQLIHCFETRPGSIYPALLIQHKRRVPLLSDWNDWFGRGGLVEINRPKWYRLIFGGMETYYEEVFRPRCAGLTVISTALAQRAANLGVHPKHICHIPGGVIPEFFVNRSREVCRERVGLPLTGPILGFASADSHLDIEIALATIALLAKQFPNIQMIVTGKVNESVVKTASQYGVEKHLYMTGYVLKEDLPWWLGCADVFIMPFPETIYNVGRWPNKVGIYMSLERPIVTNPVGDIARLLSKHLVGLAAVYTPEDFAEKISLLLTNPEFAEQLGRNGRRAALTDYHWKNLTSKLEDFYFQFSNNKIPRDISNSNK